MSFNDFTSSRLKEVDIFYMQADPTRRFFNNLFGYMSIL